MLGSTIFFPNLTLFHILYVQAFVREIIEPALKEIEQMPAKGSNLNVLVLCVCVRGSVHACVHECLCACVLCGFVCACMRVHVCAHLSHPCV